MGIFSKGILGKKEPRAMEEPRDYFEEISYHNILEDIYYLDKESADDIRKCHLEKGVISNYDLNIDDGRGEFLKIEFNDLENLTRNVHKLGMYGGNLTAWIGGLSEFDGGKRVSIDMLNVEKDGKYSLSAEVNPLLEHNQELKLYAERAKGYLIDQHEKGLVSEYISMVDNYINFNKWYAGVPISDRVEAMEGIAKNPKLLVESNYKSNIKESINNIYSGHMPEVKYLDQKAISTLNEMTQGLGRVVKKEDIKLFKQDPINIMNQFDSSRIKVGFESEIKPDEQYKDEIAQLVNSLSEASKRIIDREKSIDIEAKSRKIRM